MIGSLARKLFGTANNRRVRGYQPKVAAINALEPERQIDVHWAQQARNNPQARRPISLRVYCADKPGLLANISLAFTQADVNISQAHCMTTEDQRAVNTFEVLVCDAAQIQRAIKLIEKIKGVYRVERA